MKWILVEILKLGLVNILKFKFSRDADLWLKFWRWCLVEILKIVLIKICSCDMTWTSDFGKLNSTLGSVVPLAMFRLQSPLLAFYRDYLFWIQQSCLVLQYLSNSRKILKEHDASKELIAFVNSNVVSCNICLAIRKLLTNELQSAAAFKVAVIVHESHLLPCLAMLSPKILSWNLYWQYRFQQSGDNFK